MRRNGRMYRHDEVNSRFFAVSRKRPKSTRRPMEIRQRVRNFPNPQNFIPAFLVPLSLFVLFSRGTKTNSAHRRHVLYLLTSTQYFGTCTYVGLCIYVQHIPNTKGTLPTNNKFRTTTIVLFYALEKKIP